MKPLVLIILGFALMPLTRAEQRIDGQFDRAFNVSGPVDLDAVTDAGGIAVRKGSAGTVRIHAILRLNSDWFSSTNAEANIREIERNPPVERNGSSLRIGYMRDPGLLDGVSMRLEIEVPAGSKVHAQTHSGGVEVSGVQGPVDCQTNSGGIDVRDVEGDVNVTANSGGIRLLRVKGATKARVHSGGIEAYSMGNRLDLRTNSGGIRLSQTHAASIVAETSSGGVLATLAPGAGYDVSIEAASGHITTPDLIVRGAFSRRSLEGTIHGGGPEVSIRSGSGTVRIE